MADRKTKQNQTKSNKRIRYNNSNSKHNPDERSAEAVRGGFDDSIRFDFLRQLLHGLRLDCSRRRPESIHSLASFRAFRAVRTRRIYHHFDQTNQPTATTTAATNQTTTTKNGIKRTVRRTRRETKEGRKGAREEK